MQYGSVCSGIEAASVAWGALGWQPVFFSEIEKFPCAVLAHHHGSNMPGDEHSGNGVPNYGDMTEFEGWPDHGQAGPEPIDVLVGGTPCQDYSIAGLRLGMAGARGQLSLTFVGIAARYRPRWFVWENVPGVLSSNDGRDFARFLGDLSGTIIDVPDGGWKNSGIIPCIANAYGLAYRVLDAQYCRTHGYEFAVPQRRRRVFVIGYLGDWRRAAAVLFDAESLRGDPAPRREAGQRPAPTLSARTQGGGGLGTDFDLDGGLISAEVAPTLNAHFGDKMGLENQHINGGCGHFVAHGLRAKGFDASEDGAGRSTPLVPVANTLLSKANDSHAADMDTYVPIAFDCKGTEVQTAIDGSHPTLRSMGHNESHSNAGGHAAVAYDLRGRAGGATFEGPHETANIRAADGGSSRSYVSEQWAVRRLTPTECERLQGFPDDYTQIAWRGKAADACPDGPRYKALGNSMAVNVMRVLGERIALVDALEVPQ